MSAKGHEQPPGGVSQSIRQEIARFESVHPCIYALYDLISAVPDVDLQNAMQQNVVCIEDAFVNSQEWTLSRSVADLRLGILGSIDSGKTALVHRFLTGTYLLKECPEGGRFKKEFTVDGLNYLLLIRDEGGGLESEFAYWVDVVVLVFSLDSEESFDATFWHYLHLSRYRDMRELPIVIVGTQDTISETSPRVINETHIRRIAADLRHCSYLETCAMYGLNIERVFQEACRMAISLRSKQQLNVVPPSHFTRQLSIPVTRSHAYQMFQNPATSFTNGVISPLSSHNHLPAAAQSRLRLVSDGGEKTSRQPEVPVTSNSRSDQHARASSVTRETAPTKNVSPRHEMPLTSAVPEATAKKSASLPEHASMRVNQGGAQTNGSKPSSTGPLTTPILARKQKLNVKKSSSFSGLAAVNRVSMPPPTHPAVSELPSPMSTPVLGRKKTPSKSFHDHIAAPAGDHGKASPNATPNMPRKYNRLSNLFSKRGEVRNEETGVGRSIPLKQGFVYKKSGKPLSKEWKKKYVTLLDDGRLVYYPSLNDYMDDIHGKEILLVRTTVKVPGGRPRGSELCKPVVSAASHIATNPLMLGGGVTDVSNVAQSKPIETPLIRKKHRRTKSNLKSQDLNAPDEPEEFDFTIVAIDGRQWCFEAISAEDRESWISSIEQQIWACLQSNNSNRPNSSNSTATDIAVAASIRAISGNSICADCSELNPDWASVNLGIVLCIECSGIHRNLGTHISRVRSLDLDDWPTELVTVMKAIGNDIANAVWEANVENTSKPEPSSPREIKEKWIRAKYDLKQFLPALPYRDVPLSQQLMDAVARQDVNKTVLVLSHCGVDKRAQVSAPFSSIDWRTALHITAFLGNVVILQLLLWCGADANAVDHEGHDPLYYAQVSKVPTASLCVSLLKSAQSFRDSLIT